MRKLHQCKNGEYLGLSGLAFVLAKMQEAARHLFLLRLVATHPRLAVRLAVAVATQSGSVDGRPLHARQEVVCAGGSSRPLWRG